MSCQDDLARIRVGDRDAFEANGAEQQVFRAKNPGLTEQLDRLTPKALLLVRRDQVMRRCSRGKTCRFAPSHERAQTGKQGQSGHVAEDENFKLARVDGRINGRSLYGVRDFINDILGHLEAPRWQLSQERQVADVAEVDEDIRIGDDYHPWFRYGRHGADDFS